MTDQEIENIINEYGGGLSVLFSKDEIKQIIYKVLEYLDNERERQLPN